MSQSRQRFKKVFGALIHSGLFIVTASSAAAVLFIFFFIGRDAIPFFQSRGFQEFFTQKEWYPASDNPRFGALTIFFGSGMVALTSTLIAVPLGVAASVCLSDILPFRMRQVAKPILEMLAAIPSVAYGFFALVVLAPLLQKRGGLLLGVTAAVLCTGLLVLVLLLVSDLLASRFQGAAQTVVRVVVTIFGGGAGLWGIYAIYNRLGQVEISSGTNALNVSVILAIMALPTIVSVSEDALQAVGRDLRQGSYAMGATRAETVLKVVLPAASSGICAAVILGFMRAIGETMVVWMASGNAAQIPEPWYNLLEPVRTLTATVAGDMGEADQVTGADRYHVLFAMALSLLVISFVLNLLSEWAVRRNRRKLQGE
ncbi:MAG: PstC family ABC transporter permease [Planctomycetota bacterium]